MADFEGSQTRLVVVGDGPERERLERMAESLDVNAQFEGLVDPDDVDEYYCESSVFVLPSTEDENLSNVVLEATAWGVPVITTDSGGLRAVVDDRRNGYVVPMRSPDAIANRIQSLL